MSDLAGALFIVYYIYAAVAVVVIVASFALGAWIY